MKSAIRLDDITPDMDWERYKRIEKILDDANIRPLIGLVPFNKDDNLNRAAVAMGEEEFEAYLHERSERDWKIALHGYNHLYTTKKMGVFPLNNFSEYAGLSFDRQLVMLREGRDKLQDMGIDTDIFMTPAHTYDRNTIKALKEAGFKRVTDGFGKGPYIRGGLTFFPISRKQSECVSDKPGYTTLVLHTNTMTDRDIENFEKRISDYRDNFIDYEDYLNVPSTKRTAIGNLVEYFTALAKFCLVRLRSR